MIDRIPKYTIKDLPRIRRKYKPGDYITVRKEFEIQGGRKIYRQIRYRIMKRFKHHLSCADIKTGVLESFNYFMLDRDRNRILERGVDANGYKGRVGKLPEQKGGDS